jgi:hypothetical protein
MACAERLPYFGQNVKAIVRPGRGFKTQSDGVYHLPQPFGYFPGAKWRTMSSIAAFSLVPSPTRHALGAGAVAVSKNRVVRQS